MLVSMYVLYIWLCILCMHVCTCSPLLIYISERYLIFFKYLISVCWQLVSLWTDCIGVFLPDDGRPGRARGLVVVVVVMLLVVVVIVVVFVVVVVVIVLVVVLV